MPERQSSIFDFDAIRTRMDELRPPTPRGSEPQEEQRETRTLEADAELGRLHALGGALSGSRPMTDEEKERAAVLLNCHWEGHTKHKRGCGRLRSWACVKAGKCTP